MSQDTQDRPAREGDELIDAVAAGERAKPAVTVEEANDATAWLLSDEPEDNEVSTKSLELNVGTADKPRWVAWEIEAVDEAVIKRILREGDGGGNRAARRRRGGGGDDGADANLKIVTAGTRTPNLVEVAKARGFADPSLIVRMKFKKKPGLIGQIADEIMAISGFDEGDVREGREVAVAGN